jgi:hypothetical protein
MEEAGNKNALAPINIKLKGREPVVSNAPVVPPILSPNQLQRNPSSSPLCDEVFVTTLLVISLHGNHPPAPTCPCQKAFFGQPLTRRF